MDFVMFSLTCSDFKLEDASYLDIGLIKPNIKTDQNSLGYSYYQN